MKSTYLVVLQQMIILAIIFYKMKSNNESDYMQICYKQKQGKKKQNNKHKWKHDFSWSAKKCLNLTKQQQKQKKGIKKKKLLDVAATKKKANFE